MRLRSGSGIASWLPSLGVVSGASVLTRIFSAPSSTASARVKLVSAAFAPA
jgi:hypothetical protein